MKVGDLVFCPNGMIVASKPESGDQIALGIDRSVGIVLKHLEGDELIDAHVGTSLEDEIMSGIEICPPLLKVMFGSGETRIFSSDDLEIYGRTVESS